VAGGFQPLSQHEAGPERITIVEHESVFRGVIGPPLTAVRISLSAGRRTSARSVVPTMPSSLIASPILKLSPQTAPRIDTMSVLVTSATSVEPSDGDSFRAWQRFPARGR
jgi:hypothetical protein